MAGRWTFTAETSRGKRAPRNNPFFMGTSLLVKADLGTKRACPSCNAHFYDLEKRPIVCPKCDFSYEPEALFKQRRRQPEPASVVRAVETEDEDEEDEDEDGEAESEEDEEAEAVVEAPLNVAATGEDEDEAAEEPETAEGMSVVEADEDGALIEDIEVGDDEDEEGNDLLGEVEDEEDDVSGIIDAGITKDEG